MVIFASFWVFMTLLRANYSLKNQSKAQINHHYTHRSQQCHFEPPQNFLVIGHAGGDPVNFCENTIEATSAALNQGANAIEIDLSISKDNVVFLWHDPSPFSLHAFARRFGYALSGRCRPKMSLTCTSSQLDWSQISQQWYYEDLAFGGLRSPQKIPTLAEFLEHFVDDPRLKLIWLDVKAQKGQEISALVHSLTAILNKHHVPSQRIQFSAHEKDKGEMLQRQFLKSGFPEFAQRVVVDTVPYTTFFGGASQYNGIEKALPALKNPYCGCCANLGRPLLGTGKWATFKNLVNFNVAHRNQIYQKTQNYIQIFVWTIDQASDMKWLLKSGIDGIITNYPRLLIEQFVK